VEVLCSRISFCFCATFALTRAMCCRLVKLLQKSFSLTACVLFNNLYLDTRLSLITWIDSEQWLIITCAFLWKKKPKQSWEDVICQKRCLSCRIQSTRKGRTKWVPHWLRGRTLVQPFFRSVWKLCSALFWEVKVPCRNLSRCRIQDCVLKLLLAWPGHWPKLTSLFIRLLWIPKMVIRTPGRWQGILLIR